MSPSNINKKILLNAALAGALLGGQNLLAAAGSPAMKMDKADSKSVVKGFCEGINACKGQGECAQPGHECAKVNECKGKGVVQVTKKECDAKKGKWKG